MKSIVVLLMVVGFEAMAQCTPPQYSTAWLRFTDGENSSFVLWWGFDQTAHYGIDPHLCEVALPPCGPTPMMDVRFSNIPGRDGMDDPQGLGQGTYEDYRLNTSGRDTFKVKFQAGNGVFPVRFSWSPSAILAFCDSAILQDEFGGVLIRANMGIDSSIVISNPAFHALLIVTSRLVKDVEPSDDEIPIAFMVAQNYPNPFNPSTRIEYEVPRQAHVRLSVANVLGEEVAVLVDAERSPGRYAADFDATLHASGVYFYRMVAGNVVHTRRMIVTK
ncbi:MAG: T9SS type A sorting domain-containing protein [Bacteroidota bacterium]